MWRNIGLQICFIAFATALAGEIRVAPYGWDFRFGLGSSAFFLLLLMLRHVPYIKTGIITGIVVMIFRTFISPTFLMDPATFFQVCTIHLSAMFYYWAFGFGMSIIKEKFLNVNLFLLGAIVVLIDVGSNMVEIFARYLILDMSLTASISWVTTIVVAIVRVYFVIGVYANVKLVQLKALHNEQEKRLNQVLEFGSNLYIESFYLNKTMQTIEQITSQSYHLFRRLDKQNLKEEGREALKIAEQIHEVKKDVQRITSGLNNLYDSKTTTEMDLSHLLKFIIKGNANYSKWLKKDIKFELDQGINFKTSHYLLIITILNNLIANAVEAIEKKGKIMISIKKENDFICFTVIDNGQGIKEKDLPLIFEAGFTTKYNEKGTAATGIGLVHVKSIISIFHGEIVTNLADSRTEITILLPANQIIKRE